MHSKRRVIVFLDQRDVDTLKLDALLTHSTVSARLREVIIAHCKTLALGHPRALFERAGAKETLQ